MIHLEKLRKEFDELVAVNDLDVVIPEGEIYGLIGPNGAGKTTTIRMACGLLQPTDGRVFISGVDVHEEPERAQRFIGYLSDFFSVYDDLKVWEYLDYFAHAYKMPESEIPARIDEAIQQVGLEVKRDELIKGLSRGMKQRLGIARAVIHRPKVLLLDEPASGLDPKARRNVLQKSRICASGGAAMPPQRGHGDMSLKCKGGLRTIVSEGRVENGNSQLRGIAAPNAKSLITVGLTRKNGGQLKNQTEYCICVPAETTPWIQEAHILIGHILVEIVER